MKRGSGITFLFFSSLLVVASACSSGNSSSAGGACGNYVSALRDAAKECGRFNISPARESEYIARLQRSCENALNAPGSGIAPGLLDQCANKIREACGDDDACEDVLEDARGTLADGAVCDVDYQCASGQCKTSSTTPTQGSSTCGKCAPAAQIGEPCPDGGCVTGASCKSSFDGSTNTSVCVAVKTVNEGDECGSSSSTANEVVRCATGLYCQYTTSSTTGTSGKCAQPAPEGAACASGSSDGQYVRCKAPSTCVNGKCGRLLGAGQACEDSSDCGAGLGCDPQGKTCASIVWGATGAPCDDNLRRCERGFCGRTSTSGTSVEGTCIAYLADGSPCDQTKQGSMEQCDSFARCLNGTCQLQDPAQCK